MFLPAVVRAAETDADGDGLQDVWEMSIFQTDPQNADSDRDSHADRLEVRHGWNPLGLGRLKEADFDADGLSDRLELLFGSDPMNGDTDGDGYKDGAEIRDAFSPTSTSSVPLPKSLRIVLKTQRIEKVVNGVAIEAFPVSTGLPRTPTPVGTFKVIYKHPRAWSRSYGLWMPYWMGFTARGHGIHELPEWPGGRKEGVSHLGRPASHGCVRTAPGTAKDLYEWTPVGTPVVVVRG